VKYFYFLLFRLRHQQRTVLKLERTASETFLLAIGKVPLVFVCEREVSRIVNLFNLDLNI